MHRKAAIHWASMGALRGAGCVALGLTLGVVFVLVALWREKTTSTEDVQPLTPFEVSAGSPDPFEPNPILAAEGLTHLATLATQPGFWFAVLAAGVCLGGGAAPAFLIDDRPGLIWYAFGIGLIFPLNLIYAYFRWRRFTPSTTAPTSVSGPIDAGS